ncbi:MAG: acetylornithine deacetylase [Sediminimonas qiaohouensis]|uniref:Acetylornithine deacetylase n=1 Tax=Sediminimonas qiaohouensis TaxID=552061 RepID=A0A7C9H9G2_9RHOB|nr:acetylornithine deacetylase [Sediminimonas qiaohouensis]MTJ03389.1 acetylornithine deacetylase [Sediminimonas qiaohouensis]
MTARLTPFELMEKLVSFPTVSRDSNLALVEWVDGYLADHGITAHRHYSDNNEKAALFAHAGPEAEGGVVLSGHTDVVPVDGQPWATDPFTVDVRDGKYFGRGCVDMKGFDALAIWALVEAHHAGVKRPLQLALSYDEEIGCVGAPPMIRAMQERLPPASTVIVGEPSMMQAVTGHKGGQGFWTRIIGFEVHSSIMHEGVNAIMYGAKLIEWANRTNAENMAATPSDLAAMFHPPWTTLHVGTIEGGTAHNITAKECRFGMDFRVVPGEDPDEWRERYMEQVRAVEAQMQAVRPEARIEVSQKFFVPGLKPETDGAAEALVRAITGDNAGHVVSYGTEAGLFQRAGYSAIVCGPGDIAQAHQPDEYITQEQFDAGHDFMRRLVTRLQDA